MIPDNRAFFSVRSMSNELQGGLQAIYKNIDKYYPKSEQDTELLEENRMAIRKPKIFISHATKVKIMWQHW